MKEKQADEVTVLQNLLFPKNDVCSEKELYFRLSKNASFCDFEQKIELKKLSSCAFNTYFNAYFCGKREEITSVEKIYFCIEFKGEIEVTFYNSHINEKEEIVRAIVGSSVIKSAVKSTQILSLPTCKQGMIYPTITCVGEKSDIYGGYYFTNDNRPRLPQIAIVICTYRREDFILSNIARIKEFFRYNDKNLFKVFIIDNGNTLEDIKERGIEIIANSNYGGAGGFARGMMEASKENFSHVVLMDDDVIFEADVFVRLYSVLAFLKEEFLDAFIGGGMLRLDKKTIQSECANRWDFDRNKVKPLGHNLDLTVEKNLLRNEEIKNINYLSWWFCCIPMETVKNNLPLPIFIKRDDIEYGLRCGKKFITLNGLCVWHQPFEEKRSPILEYYYLRNRLIMDSVLNVEKSLFTVKKEILVATLKNIKSKDFVSAYLRLYGAFHFIQGAEFLMRTHPNSIHRFLLAKVPAHPPRKWNNILTLIPIFFKVIVYLTLRYKKAVNSYQSNYQYLTSYKFWEEYLSGKNLSDTIPTIIGKLPLKKALTLLSYYTVRAILKIIPIPMDDYKITVYVRGRKGFCDNPKYLVHKLISLYGDKFKIFWITDDIEYCQDIPYKNVMVINNKTIEHLKAQLSSKFIIYNDYLPAYIPKKKEQVYINLWHGGINYKNIGIEHLHNKSYFNKKRFSLRNPQPDYMVSGSEFFTRDTARSFGYSESIFIPCGLPRNDILFDVSVKEKISKKVKAFYGVSGKNIALYAPTFRVGCTPSLYGLKVDNLLHAFKVRFGGEWTFFYRAHGFIKDALDTANEGIIDVSNYPDVQELLLASSAVITDYSSLSWDASFLNLPIFLYAPDIDDYARFDRNFAYPIDRLPYLIACDNESLLNNVFTFNNDAYVKKIRAHHLEAGSYENANSSEIIARLINSLAKYKGE